MSSLTTTLRMIKFEHTVFALPFALSGAWIAASGIPPWADLLAVLVAAVAARSAAMAFNRISDLRFDATNPRTADRELVTGALSLRYAVLFTIVNSLIFLGVATWLSPLCGLLALPVLGVLLGYSRLKRFGWFCHFGLGLALGLAPAGAWLAVSKGFDGDWWVPLGIGLGVLLWVAGFDLLYSLQDIEHDRREGLHSFPSRFGVGPTRIASMACYLLALLAWAWVGQRLESGGAYFLGLGLLACILAAEHWLLRGSRLEHVPLVFFRINAWVGVVYFAALWLDLSALHP